MRRSKRTAKKVLTPVRDESSSDEEEPPVKKMQIIEEVNLSESSDEENPKPSNSASKRPRKLSDSSSASSIDCHLKPTDKIDLNSSFFSDNKNSSYENVEKKIFEGVSRLTDSESEEETSKEELKQSQDKNVENAIKVNDFVESNYQQLVDYKNRIEEAKKHAEQYLAKQEKQKSSNTDIGNLLASIEGSSKPDKAIELHSSDFESCDSEEENWEEVKTKEPSEECSQKSVVPLNGVEIVVDMPTTVKKKKGVDLIAALKRRLNRIRKENQFYIHRVSLLCWIGHGNFINGIINNPETMALAMSLLPSDKCYPSNRTDLNYLEQVVKWFKKAVVFEDKKASENGVIIKSLHDQIKNKVAVDRKMLVYIFIAMLRSLGIQCRLVLSFLAEPLRPPANELHSLSNKDAKDETKSKKNKSGTSVVGKKASETKGKVVKPKDEVKVKKEAKSKSKAVETKPKIKEELKEKIVEARPKRKIEAKPKKEVGTGEKEESEEKIIKAKPKRKIETKKKKESTEKVIEAKPKKEEKKKTVTTRGKKGSSKEPTKNEVKESPFFKKQTELVVNVERHNNKVQNEVDSKQEKENRKVTQELSLKQKAPTIKEPATASTSKATTRSKKAIIKVKAPVKNKTKLEKIPQADGPFDSSSDEEDIPQLDGGVDEEKSPRKLRTRSRKDKLKISIAPMPNSEDEFRPRSPFSPKTDHNTLRRKSPVKSSTSNSPTKNTTSNAKTIKLPSKSPTKSPFFAGDVKQDIIQLVKGRVAEEKQKEKSRQVKRRAGSQDDSDEDSDYVPIEPTKKVRGVPTQRKVLSSDSEEETKGKGKKKGKKPVDVWAEVYLEMEEKWISVDVVHGAVHCVNELYSRATHPVSYIVAWNNDNSLKDITSRYCQNFNTVTRKQRTDAKWWTETLKPFSGPKTARDREEDEELARQQIEKPLPTSIAEYKNHPLYVLGRHLLKFEAIYPEDAPTLGFVRGEPVYSRKCVYTLRSRDIWLKEAKTVKMGEKPYKIVKARPKYDKLSNKVITDQLLEIFGPWQVEEYVPPTAENGVVPRNAFGNVELFKMCMLPKKTVHLKLPGLNKIARRLNIDCATAIVGFDFHGGWSHPTYDGFVVCEEFEDQLVAAWHLEQEEIERKEQEKLEARVYGNWKKLIKGLLIRERLKSRYDFAPVEEGGSKDKKKAKGPRFCTKKT